MRGWYVCIGVSVRLQQVALGNSRASPAQRGRHTYPPQITYTKAGKVGGNDAWA